MHEILVVLNSPLFGRSVQTVFSWGDLYEIDYTEARTIIFYISSLADGMPPFFVYQLPYSPNEKVSRPGVFGNNESPARHTTERWESIRKYWFIYEARTWYLHHPRGVLVFNTLPQFVSLKIHQAPQNIEPCGSCEWSLTTCLLCWSGVDVTGAPCM